MKLFRNTLLLAVLVFVGVLATSAGSALADAKCAVGETGTPPHCVAAPTPAPTPAPSQSLTDACNGLSELDSSNSCGKGTAGINNIVSTVVSILSYVIGTVAIIMIIISGFKYITSSGDSNNISSAKNTLIYALVGLFVAVLAQFLVHFVISNTPDATVKPAPIVKPKP